MVAQCKTSYASTTLIYLGLILFVGCSSPEVTIVELKNIDPLKLTTVIERYTEDGISYDIIDKKIIFHANHETVLPLITLIDSLDNQDNQYLLSFNWGKHKRYTTQTLPTPISLSLEIETPINLFNKEMLLQLSSVSSQQYILKIKHKNKAKQSINSITLNSDTKIQFNEPTSTEFNTQARLIENQATLIENDLMPQGLHIMIEKL